MRILAIAALAAVGLTFSMVDGASAKGKCVLASAKGFGPGPDFATDAAAQSLKYGIEQKKWKASGKVTTKCDGELPITTCTASQRACG